MLRETALHLASFQYLSFNNTVKLIATLIIFTLDEREHLFLTIALFIGSDVLE